MNPPAAPGDVALEPREASLGLGGLPPMKARTSSITRRAKRTAIFGTLPTWLILIPIGAVPLVVGLWLSVRDENLVSPLPATYVGLENYRTDVFNATFGKALIVTLVIMAIGLLVQVPLGLFLAVLLNRAVRGTQLFRSALITPMLLTPVAVALMFRFMFNSELGVINWALSSLHLPRLDWLGESGPALLAVVIVDSWQAVPFIMLLLLAGLTALPQGPKEAASVDGASAWQSFRYVTLPMLTPVLLVTIMIRLIDGFKLFDIIFILTRGGPGTDTQTVSMLDYNTAFTFLATSRAAAIGTVLAILTLPVYFVWIRVTRIEQ